MSRQDLVDSVRETLEDLGLDDSYGITETEHGKYAALTFCKARILDGEVRVYGPKFTYIKWITGIRNLPHEGKIVIRDFEKVAEFLKMAFVDFNEEALDLGE